MVIFSIMPGQPVYAQLLELTVEEKVFIADHPVIPFCVDPAFMPFEQINASGRHEGIFADYLSLISEKTGLSFQLVPAENYRQTRELFEKGVCKLVPGADAIESDRYGVSTTYLTSESGYVVHSSREGAADFGVMVEEGKIGYIGGADIKRLRESYPQANFIEAGSDLDGIRKVATGELDAFVSTLLALDYTIRHSGITRVQLKIRKMLGDGPNFAAHIHPGSPQLLRIINKAIEQITAKEQDEIIQHWFQPMVEEKLYVRTLKRTLLGTIFVLLVVALLYLLQKKKNQQLQLKLIERKSAERERLLEEVHDGFGSQLMSARLMIMGGEYSKERLVELMGECIDDLHLVVDLFGNQGVTLEEALAQYRYRMQLRLVEMGVEIEWKIELQECFFVTEHATLQLLRILQEAIHNSLKHAGAKQIRVTARCSEGHHLQITVQDNGVGLPDELKRNRGIGNMERRAASIGARFSIGNAKPGVLVEVTLRS